MKLNLFEILFYVTFKHSIFDNHIKLGKLVDIWFDKQADINVD